MGRTCGAVFQRRNVCNYQSSVSQPSSDRSLPFWLVKESPALRLSSLVLMVRQVSLSTSKLINPI